MSTIVSLGDLVLDLICPVKLPVIPFDHQEVPPIRPEPGGGCNFLLAAKHLGAEIQAVGAVGDDIFGTLLIDVLKQEGVDTRGIFIAPGSTSAVVLDLIDPKEKVHTFIGHMASGSPAPYTEEIDAIIRSAGAIFFQGYTLLETQIVEVVDTAVRRAYELNIPIYFDVGPPAAHADLERLRRMLRYVTVLMSTEDEIPLVTLGLAGEAAFEDLLGMGIRTIVMKRGGDGCALITGGGRIDVPSFKVEVVDTVGAGDCFNAAFIHGRLRGMSLKDAATLANAMGAACVKKVAAGRNAPTREEVSAVLSQEQVSLEF
jgi:sugar/nucleoside kinase (ribokinase family)